MCLLLLKEKYCSKWIVKEPESFRGIWTELLGIVNPHFVFDVCLNPVDWPLPPAWPPFPPALWSLCLSPESPFASSEARWHKDGKLELESEPTMTKVCMRVSVCVHTRVPVQSFAVVFSVDSWACHPSDESSLSELRFPFPPLLICYIIKQHVYSNTQMMHKVKKGKIMWQNQ